MQGTSSTCPALGDLRLVRAGHQESTFRPSFSTTANSLSAIPLGRFVPVSHFRAVDSLVFEVAREHGLADVCLLADFPDLPSGENRRCGQARLVESAHGGLIDSEVGDYYLFKSALHGAGCPNRTDDLPLTRRVLYQLS